MNEPVTEEQIKQLADAMAVRIGLKFPPERWKDLQRGLASVAQDLGFNNVKDCLEWILTAPLSPQHIAILADHFTIGETYFFRERAAFDMLKDRILPELINARRNGTRSLRIWCAGCCTGEEAFSTAIILNEMIPDLKNWNITLLATDVSRRFLGKAISGVYTKWSFRDTPPGIIERYFQPTDKGHYKIIPDIKRMVTFSFHNLAQDNYPSVLNNTNAMDVILCRNVLMYFTPEQSHRVVQRLYLCLSEKGWLVVSPVEVSHVLFSQYATVKWNDVILYRKEPSFSSTLELPLQQSGMPSSIPAQPITPDIPPLSSDIATMGGPDRRTMSRPAEIAIDEPESQQDPGSSSDQFETALSLYNRGLYSETVEQLMELVSRGRHDVKVMGLLARAYANQGRLEEARQWCERSIAADKFNADHMYLLSTILQEIGEMKLAELSLTQSLYIDPRYTLSYFALGNMARLQGKPKAARKYFTNALDVLTEYQPDDVLPGSDGMTAGRLTDIIRILI